MNTRLKSPSRENYENWLYDQYRKATEDERPEIFRRLFKVLTVHASRVIYMILRSLQEDMAEELAQDALLEIDSFQGDSLFSTWFHARVKYHCYNVRRSLRSRNTTYLSQTKDTSAIDAVETRVILQELMRDWSDTERKVVDYVLEGYTVREIADILGISAMTVSRTWQRILDRIREHGTSK